MYELQVSVSKGEEIEEFNNTFAVHSILTMSGWQPHDEQAIGMIYLNKTVYSDYVKIVSGKEYRTIVNIDNRGHFVEIHAPEKIKLDGSFDCYVHFVMGGDVKQAMNWKNDPRLNTVNNVNVTQPQQFLNSQIVLAQQVAIPQLHYIQRNYHQSQQYPIPLYPKIDIDLILDSKAPKNYLNLHFCILDENSILKQLPSKINQLSNLPFSTILSVMLGVFSGLTSKKWNIAYEDGRTVPTSLYVVAESASGNSKSRVLNLLQQPLFNLIESSIAQFQLEVDMYHDTLDEYKIMLEGATSKEEKAKNKKAIAEAKIFVKQLDKKLARMRNLKPITNATPEALDPVLQITNGYYFASAAEQGLFNSICGLSYGKKANNNDVMLNGRDGGEVNSRRVGRNSYSGKVIGAVVNFAQENSIEKLLAASNVTGLAERFLMISEPDFVGYRNHEQIQINIDDALAEYAKKCDFFKEILNQGTPSDDLLITLKISTQCWRFIHSFENNLESHLRHNGALSHPILRRIVSKTRMQVMGIAANLYLLDTHSQPLTTSDDPFIPQEYVTMAINIYDKLIVGVRHYCERKGLINDNVQISTVYNMFIGKSDSVSFTAQELKKKCEQVKPFKELESPRIAVNNTIDYLTKNNILLEHNGRYYRNLEQFVLF